MKVVSFFAGCGGLDLGFEQAGFKVVWANEFEPHCRATYQRNHPNTEFAIGDVCKIDPTDIPECDGFVGGPPCQSWSVAGRQKGLEDERGRLFLKYIELIKAKQPKFFLIENVKGLLDNKFRDVFSMFLDKLSKANYDVKWQLLDAVNYGVPQNRERVFIVGFRKNLNVNYEFPDATHPISIPLECAIGDIKEQPKEYGAFDRIEPNVQRPNHDVLTTKFSVYYSRGNRRRGWHQPSFTIHATGDNVPLHPSSPKMMYLGDENWEFQKDKMSQYRRLSVRECARIQTFPDNIIFEYDNIKTAYEMIGNAVPPRLAKALAVSIQAALQNVQLQKVKKKERSVKDACLLVGYFKGCDHHRLILKNMLYYVRSDGRLGSIFKEDCSTMPEYLMIHHKEQIEIYELVVDEPMLVDASFLKSLGFGVSGQKYLCFRLKNKKMKFISEFGGEGSKCQYDPKNYLPYFTTIGELIK